MRKFYPIGSVVISILCCCTFLFAQEKVYQEFVEAEIVLNDTISIADIEALPKAPGSSIEISNDGSTVRVQIPAATAQELAEGGVQITLLRSFLLVQNANPVLSTSQIQASASSSYEYGDEGTDVHLGPSGWEYSYINFSGFPSYTVTGVDVHYQVVVNGIVDLKLANANGSLFYNLEETASWSLNETATGISTFNGQPLAQAWVLCGYDYYGYNSYIDYWWIKVYYENTSSYCTASGGCDEYIYEVVVGNIDNISACDNYADYTSQSTTMDVGTSYPIEIITAVNGEPYAGYEKDRCGIWIDWNQDGDFDDTGEMVFSEINYGYFTTNITPPADALKGNTRMRIRLAYDTTLSPCGAASYGEVEDYTINVADSAPPTLKVSGYITHRWDDSSVSEVLLEIYNGSGAGVSTGLTDISDATGYYEIEVPSPWTGHVKATKEHYAFSWVTNFTNVTTDQVQDFSAYYTYSGGFGSSGSPYLIATAEDMNAIGSHSEDWGQYFKMTADIDLSAYTDTQFKLIGTQGKQFLGVFDGNEHNISNFTYADNSTSSYKGLFGHIGINGVISNLKMTNVNVSASHTIYFGALCGYLDNGTISNCSINNGTVIGYEDCGGMIGRVSYGTVENCSSNLNVVGTQNVGTLVGSNIHGLITKSGSSGNVAGDSCVGGLAGYNYSSGYISECFSNAEVFGDYAGGLVGYSGSSNSSVVINCYSRGNVGGNHVGGFMATNYCAKVQNCYSTGSILEGQVIGGFISSTNGCLNAVCINSYWDRQTSGTSYSYQGTKKTTAEMMQRATFVDWDFESVWKMCDGTGYPKLIWQKGTPGDFDCPDGVDFVDYSILAKQWLLEKLSYDVSPTGGDGIVDFSDFAVFANNWQGDMIQLSEFISQWLQPGMYNADIAPVPDGDGVVDTLDFAVFAENWLESE